MWKDMIKGFFLLNRCKGSANSLSILLYRLIGLFSIPKVIIPGKRVSKERMKELLEDEE